MTDYSIGAVSKLTGITTHNLRVWEKRHGLAPGGRSESGRRVYSQKDVERLGLIKQCIDLGHSIGNLADQDIDELKTTLAQLAQADLGFAGSNQDVFNLAIISEVQPQVDQQSLSANKINWLPSCKNINDCIASGDQLDLVVFEVAIVTEELLNQITLLKSRKTPHLILCIYRVARQADITRLRNLGVRTVRAPLETLEIEDILFRFIERISNQGPLSSLEPLGAEASQRKFTMDQLESLKQRPYNLNCECPRHISEIIKAMEAFETYSLQCQNETESDAALHNKIFNETSSARHAMENILEEVLKSEGIELAAL